MRLKDELGNESNASSEIEYHGAEAMLLGEEKRGVPIKSNGWRIAERMALVLQGALLVRHAPAAVSDAFCATRLDENGGRSFGVLPDRVDFAAIVERQRC